jgi:putative transposase
MIDREEPVSVSRQCALVGVSRSSVYYRPVAVKPAELALMQVMDRLHLQYPFYGSRGLRNALRDFGFTVNRKKVQRLMRTMGLWAVYPQRRTTIPDEGHRVYPYVLRGVAVTRPNQVWAADITYIPLARGFVYLVAVMDWYSRKVLAWRLSNTLDHQFCVDALDEALQRYGSPEIFNTDQGAQFTSAAFIGRLQDAGIKISMDGKGRWIDNRVVERLWRSVKYEEVYLNPYASPREAERSLREYFAFYNTIRRHQGLDNRTPNAVYWQHTLKQVA